MFCEDNEMNIYHHNYLALYLNCEIKPGIKTNFLRKLSESALGLSLTRLCFIPSMNKLHTKVAVCWRKTSTFANIFIKTFLETWQLYPPIIIVWHVRETSINPKPDAHSLQTPKQITEVS